MSTLPSSVSGAAPLRRTTSDGYGPLADFLSTTGPRSGSASSGVAASAVPIVLVAGQESTGVTRSHARVSASRFEVTSLGRMTTESLSDPLPAGKSKDVVSEISEPFRFCPFEPMVPDALGANGSAAQLVAVYGAVRVDGAPLS